MAYMCKSIDVLIISAKKMTFLFEFNAILDRATTDAFRPLQASPKLLTVLQYAQ